VSIDQINGLGFGLPLMRTRNTVAFIHQTISDIWDTRPWPMAKVGRFIENAVLRWYWNTPFITVSPSTWQEMRDRGWQGEGTIAMVGSPSPSWHTKSATPTLCFLGRLNAPTKRLHLALEVFAEVRTQVPEAVFHVIGRGVPPTRSVPLGVVFHTNVSDEERNKILGESWCLIATSLREGWGMMVTEAAAAGTPAVVLDAPGLRDSVQPKRTGEIVSSPEMMVQAIVHLLTNAQERDELARAAFQFAKELSWDRSAMEFEQGLTRMRGEVRYVKCKRQQAGKL
jgi:glycosyltransferase involved in cell wall biosynthesis